MSDKYTEQAEQVYRDCDPCCDCSYPEARDKIAIALRRVAADATERAAKIAESMKGGYSASLDADILVPDKDGPWILPSQIAAAIRSAAPDAGDAAKGEG